MFDKKETRLELSILCLGVYLIILTTSDSIGSFILMSLGGLIIAVGSGWMLLCFLAFLGLLKNWGILIALFIVFISFKGAIREIESYTNKPTVITRKERTGNIAQDGTYSSATNSGASSHHGGVKEWLHDEKSRPANEKDIEIWKRDQKEITSFLLIRIYFIIYGIYGFLLSLKIVRLEVEGITDL